MTGGPGLRTAHRPGQTSQDPTPGQGGQTPASTTPGAHPAKCRLSSWPAVATRMRASVEMICQSRSVRLLTELLEPLAGDEAAHEFGSASTTGVVCKFGPKPCPSLRKLRALQCSDRPTDRPTPKTRVPGSSALMTASACPPACCRRRPVWRAWMAASTSAAIHARSARANAAARRLAWPVTAGAGSVLPVTGRVTWPPADS